MDQLEITITEKKKLVSSFNLFNFRDEIVNFMYKKTVADSSRRSMYFYVLIFFLSVGKDGKSLLKDLFDSNIEKLKSLNSQLSLRKRLKKGEYASLVKEANLTEVLKYDIIFILISCIIDSDAISEEFKDFFKNSPYEKQEFESVVKEYKNTLLTFKKKFKKSVIEDDRLSYDGENTLDLSKSVERTVNMRTSRSLDLNLHKFADVKNVSSNSPVVVQIIQNIDPEILVNIWTTYNLDEYAKNTWDILNTQLVGGFLGGYASTWLHWRLTDGKKRKEKKAAHDAYIRSKEETEETGAHKKLLENLTKSVISSNEFLQAEVKRYKKELDLLNQTTSIVLNKEKEIKDLKQKIEKLENISIKIRKK